MDTMIRVENLVKRYGNHYALSDVSFEIGEGEIVGLLGPNGAGKSTTMNILTGFLSATEGVAYIGGVSITDEPLEAKKLIGYLPEQPPVYGDMTVSEYLNFVYELKGCKLDRASHLGSIADMVKLSDVKHRLIRNLSKGYRQRVGIAQALVGDPKVIIFDEPTVGLDPKQILEVRNLIRSLAGKHTVILSTHILQEVQAVCQRIVVINHGKIIANERTEDLTRVVEENSHYRYAIMGPTKEVVMGLRGVKGVLYAETSGERDGEAGCFVVEVGNPHEARKNIFRLCADKGWPILSAQAVGGDLESIFLKLIDRANAVEAGAERRKKKGKSKA